MDTVTVTAGGQTEEHSLPIRGEERVELGRRTMQ